MGFTGSGGSLFLWFTGSLVYVVHWFMGFTGACGSPVQVIDWFMWFAGTCGSLVHWFM